ncbi:MAG TPA: TonB-dependent receptor [Dongiaceae bacterium]|nr:TonB-dependent receptor [Dongiaceae bacterium]
MARVNLAALPVLFLLSPLASGSSRDTASLMDLSLEELMTIEVSTTSLNGSTLADSASWATVIDEKSWQRTGARRTFDALAFQPATQVMPYIAGGDMVVIRGYSRTTSSRAVAMLWDGVPLSDLAQGNPTTNLSNINLFSLSSIEYTQGPGSALYGSDAFHGVIGLNSVATEGDQGMAELLAGSDGYYQGGARGSVDLGNGWFSNLALAANGQANQDASYLLEDPLSDAVLAEERAERYDTGTAVLTVGSDPTAATSFDGGYYRHRYDANGFVGVGMRFFPAPDEANRLSDFQMGRLALRHRFNGEQSLELKGYYWDLTNELDINLALGGGAVMATQNQHYDQYRYGMQLTYRDQIQPLNTRWALALAQDKMGIHDSDVRLQTDSGTVLQQGPDALQGERREINSAMLETDTALLENRWHLVLGARVDDYSDFGQQVSPRGGVIFHPAPGHALKLIYSEAFRAPSAAEMKGSSSLVLENPDLEPETTRTTELIWLVQDADATTQLSVFDSRWRNGIVSVPLGSTGLTTYRNQERNSSVGVTASHLREWRAWRFDINGSWVESRNDSLDEDYGAFPRYLLNLGLGYSAASLRTDFYLQQRAMFDMDAEVAGRTNPSDDTLPTYWRTDFTATWHGADPLDVMLVIRNLFDRNNDLPSITSDGGVEDEAFSISAGVRYRFE